MKSKDPLKTEKSKYASRKFLFTLMLIVIFTIFGALNKLSWIFIIALDVPFGLYCGYNVVTKHIKFKKGGNNG